MGKQPYRIYLVDVTLTVTVPVLARGQEEAVRVARESVEDEPRWDVENADAVAGEPLTKCPKEYVGVIPHGDQSDDTTMDQYLPVG